MKLISIEDAAAWIGLHLPLPTDYVRSSACTRYNSTPHCRPYVIIELEWKESGPVDVLPVETSSDRAEAARAEVDALSGQLINWHRFDPEIMKDQNPRVDMSSTEYERVYPHVQSWIRRLELPVHEEELRMRSAKRKGSHWQLFYTRTRDGIPVIGQTLDITLDGDYGLRSVHIHWDPIVFADTGSAIPRETFLYRLDASILSRSYLLPYSINHPYWACREDVYDAVTGEIIMNERAEMVREIDWESPAPLEPEAVPVGGGPVLNEARYAQLLIPEDIHEFDPAVPHPHRPPLSEEDKERALCLVLSYMKPEYSQDGFTYALYHQQDEEAIQAEGADRIEIKIARILHGIPVNRISAFVNSGTWELITVMDSRILWCEKEEPVSSLLASLGSPRVSAEDAWEQLRGDVDIRASYRIEQAEPSAGPLVARYTYKLVSDYFVDAENGKRVHEDELERTEAGRGGELHEAEANCTG